MGTLSIICFPALDVSIRSEDIRNRILKWSEVDPNFCTFLSPTLFGRGLPKFWDVDYQTEEPSDHVAKFRGDRPTELGDIAAKIKTETSQVKVKVGYLL